MRELEYQLEKADYQDWIHWNVIRSQNKKRQLISVGLTAAVILFFVGKNVIAAQGNIRAMIPSFLIAILLGGGMFYMISVPNQERMIWKKSGLLKLERTGSFPVVHLTLKERSMEIEVVGEELKKEYSYKDIVEIQEISRLFLLKTSNEMWQFVAKSALKDEEERKAFVAFLEEKMADAKENPDKYVLETEVAEDGGEKETEADSAAAAEKKDGGEEREAEDAPVITPVDTSRMGKIGKMAHIMAAMTEADETTEQPQEVQKAVEPAAEASEPAEKTAEPVGDTVEEAVKPAGDAAEEAVKSAGDTGESAEKAAELAEKAAEPIADTAKLAEATAEPVGDAAEEAEREEERA